VRPRIRHTGRTQTATTTKERPHEAGSPAAAAGPTPLATDGLAGVAAPSPASLLRWVEAGGDALVGVDAAGRVAFANAAFGRVFAVAAKPSPEPAERWALSRFVPQMTPLGCCAGSRSRPR
jgi:hypothetical protein